MADKAILYDPTKCTACRGCQAACKQWNENDERIPQGAWSRTRNYGSYENPPDLAHTTWLKVEFRESEAGGKVRWLFSRRACMHCTDAGCVRVCPTHALYHNPSGFVAYDKDICTGCGYCVDACPFDVPRRDGNIVVGAAKMDKCTMCTTPGLDRIGNGLKPACVKSCPPRALTFGDRDELLATGRTRVAALKAKGRSNAYLYGENELDGLHVLYVLEDSPQSYGLPENPRVSGVTLAWDGVVKPVGWALGGLTIAGLAVNFVVARQAKLANEKAARSVKKES